MKQIYLITITVAVIALGVGFFGGMKYQQTKKVPQFNRSRGSGQFRGGPGGNRSGFRPVSGEIISVDDKSITIKLSDGSSKIVLISDSTNINKAEKVDKSTLQVGNPVAIFGQDNSDGSVTAQNIQLNPLRMDFNATPKPPP